MLKILGILSCFFIFPLNTLRIVKHLLIIISLFLFRTKIIRIFQHHRKKIFFFNFLLHFACKQYFFYTSIGFVFFITPSQDFRDDNRWDDVLL